MRECARLRLATRSPGRVLHNLVSTERCTDVTPVGLCDVVKEGIIV